MSRCYYTLVKAFIYIHRSISKWCDVVSLVLNIFIFSSFEKQVHTTSTYIYRFCFLGTIPGLAPNVWANENPKVDTRSQESNSGPYDCEADALPHDHGHHDAVSFTRRKQ